MANKRTYHHGDLKNALIEAGIEVLAKEGVGSLSLRQVARKAGVSHAAPYAHFADKQALIAAISTEGYRALYDKLARVVQQHNGDPMRQLVEIAWAYAEFAVTDTDHFKITFSGVLEKEKDYPAFVEISKKSFDLVVEVVEACQAKGVLPDGPSDLIAVSLWGMLHGLMSLVLEGQVSHTILDRVTLRELVVYSLSLITLTKIDRKLAAQSRQLIGKRASRLAAKGGKTRT
jgi:AcrR family transcriptional regulator